jgi:hypothetical protein
LLEICEAERLQKPIVVLELKGPGKQFSFEKAFALLADLESNLRALNPMAIVELQAHSQQPLSEMQETVRKILETARARGVPHLNINGWRLWKRLNPALPFQLSILCFARVL